MSCSGDVQACGKLGSVIPKLAGSMRHPITKIAVATVLGFVALGAITAAALPIVRHTAWASWNSPGRLAALPDNPQVHYEDGAGEYARAVAALLPTAIAQVESAHGRPFAHPVTIGVFVSREVFDAANGLTNPGAVGVTFLGRVLLPPGLYWAQRQRLPAILTHELSHAHLQGWISQLTFFRLPNWFTEGLAVMVSSGGGAEGVSAAQARDAIRRGDHIAVESAGSVLNVGQGITFKIPQETPNSSSRTLMAYRQGGLFVTYLHDSNPVGFGRMMAAILDGRPFAEAVKIGYEADLGALWLEFTRVM